MPWGVVLLVLVEAIPLVLRGQFVVDGVFACLVGGEPCRELPHPLGEAQTKRPSGRCKPLLLGTAVVRCVVLGLGGRGRARLVEAEVGAVPAGGLDPFLAGFVGGAGDDVHGVGVLAAGERDVRGGGVGAVGEEAVGVVGGVVLDAVHGGCVRQV